MWWRSSPAARTKLTLVNRQDLLVDESSSVGVSADGETTAEAGDGEDEATNGGHIGCRRGTGEPIGRSGRGSKQRTGGGAVAGLARPRAEDRGGAFLPQLEKDGSLDSFVYSSCSLDRNEI
jgi:hypothetical protein